MNKNMVGEILEELNRLIPGESSAIEISENAMIPLAPENFHEIKGISSDKRLAFIDGGNAEILAAPNFSLHFIRVYYSVYQKNKRIRNKKVEFYSLATAFRDDIVKFKTKIFPEKVIDDFSLKSNDKTLKTGIHRFGISKIGEIARRLAELQIAANLTDELNKGDFIVLDGNLQSSFTNEDTYLKSLFKKAEGKGIIIAALSKTSALFSDTGDSFNVALDRVAPHFPWYYPADDLNVCFVKLNQNSNYIFKLETNSLAMELISLLMENSNDPIFPGYPYGLVEADKFARVSNREVQYLQTVLIAKAGKDWRKLNQYTKSIDAHAILDRIG